MQTASEPATLAVEVTAPCRDNEQHRIWVHRDGSVTVPDHTATGPEDVAHALGYIPHHPCALFLRSSTTGQHTPSPPNPSAPGVDVTQWRVTQRQVCTAAACWVANTAITGVTFYDNIAPWRTLAYMQVYQAHERTPRDVPTHLRYLTSPWSRPTGWRREEPVMPEELDEILSAGIPAERAASALALGLTGDSVRSIRSRLRGNRAQQVETLLMLAHAIAPHETMRYLDQGTPVATSEMLHRCHQLKARLADGSLPLVDVPSVLFGPSPA